MTLEDRILRLARLGMTPYQIEEQLGLKHFTIHIGYHKVLQQGYSENEAFFDRPEEEARQRDADRGRADRKTKDKAGGGQG